jgi:hypothetical protein
LDYFYILLLLNDRHQKNGENWLFKKIDEYTNTKNNCLQIPKKKIGDEYKLQDLNEGQFKIAYVILKKIKEWLRLATATTAQKKKFKPLRMTIMGCGGTGKSVLINTLVTCIRKIFDDNDSVFVTAPTGAAAYNVGGSTIHREFKINVRDVPGYSTLSDNTKNELMKNLLQTIALFFDERSMIGLMLLSQTELNIKETVHNGGHDTEDWGGIPVVAIFGNDYQLPPPFIQALMFLLNRRIKTKLSRMDVNSSYV